MPSLQSKSNKKHFISSSKKPSNPSKKKDENLHLHSQSQYRPALPPVGGARALPEVGAPTPPAGDAAAARGRRGHLVTATRAQLDVALEAADEVRRSTQFAEVFGARYATAEGVANAIEFATRWSREALAAEAWASYARGQSYLAWDFTNAVLEKVRAPFLAASGSDSAFEKELHAFARLLRARSDAAKRGALTRSANKRAKPKPAPSPPATASPISPMSPVIVDGSKSAPPVTNGIAH